MKYAKLLMIFVKNNSPIVTFPSGRMLDLARHEWVGIAKEHIEACVRTEIDPLTLVFRAGIFGRVFDPPAAGCFEFRFSREVCLIVVQVHPSLLS